MTSNPHGPLIKPPRNCHEFFPPSSGTSTSWHPSCHFVLCGVGRFAGCTHQTSDDILGQRDDPDIRQTPSIVLQTKVLFVCQFGRELSYSLVIDVENGGLSWPYVPRLAKKSRPSLVLPSPLDRSVMTHLPGRILPCTLFLSSTEVKT